MLSPVKIPPVAAVVLSEAVVVDTADFEAMLEKTLESELRRDPNFAATWSLLRVTLTVAGPEVTAVAVTSTIKQAGSALPSIVERTVPRSTLWAMQTPQVARRATLSKAFERCPLPLDQVTDDVQLLELAGEPVLLVPGEERNLKITTATDLTIARALLAGAVPRKG